MEKIIHYCWFGPKPFGKLEKKCLKSWQKFFPDYKIIKWSEENVDLEECDFIKEAYKNKKWAFVADYVRTKALYEYGGIYFDTDMEVIKDFRNLIDDTFVVGLEDSGRPAAGVVIAPNKKNKYMKKLLSMYRKMKFNETGNLFEISIPVMYEKILCDKNYVSVSNNVQKLGDITLYPREYFYPLSYDFQDNIFTDNTVTIHHYSGSWTSKKQKIGIWFRRHKLGWIIDFLLKIKNREVVI